MNEAIKKNFRELMFFLFVQSRQVTLLTHPDREMTLEENINLSKSIKDKNFQEAVLEIKKVTENFQKMKFPNHVVLSQILKKMIDEGFEKIFVFDFFYNMAEKGHHEGAINIMENFLKTVDEKDRTREEKMSVQYARLCWQFDSLFQWFHKATIEIPEEEGKILTAALGVKKFEVQMQILMKWIRTQETSETKYRPNHFIINTLFKSLTAEKNFPAGWVWQFWHRLQQELPLPVDAVRCNIMMNYLGKRGEVEQIFQLYQAMETAGIQLDPYTLSTLIDSVGEKHYQIALNLFYQLPDLHTPVVCLSLFNKAHFLKDYVHAKFIYTEKIVAMENEQLLLLRDKVNGYYKMLDIAISENDYLAVKNFFEKLSGIKGGISCMHVSQLTRLVQLARDAKDPDVLEIIGKEIGFQDEILKNTLSKALENTRPAQMAGSRLSFFCQLATHLDGNTLSDGVGEKSLENSWR